MAEETFGTPPVSVEKCREACAKEGVDWDTLSEWQQFLVTDKVRLGHTLQFSHKDLTEGT